MSREKNEMGEAEHNAQFDPDLPFTESPKDTGNYKDTALWKEHEAAIKKDKRLKHLADDATLSTWEQKLQ